MITSETKVRSFYQNSKAAFAVKLPKPHTTKYSNKSVAIRVFFISWLVFSLHFATNTVREIYPALSLGDHASFDVSEYAGLHHDIFELPGRGTFINNNPGASIIGAIPYALFRPITDRIVDRVQRSRAESPQNERLEFNTVYPLAREFYEKSRERGLDVKFGLAAAVTQAFAMAPISALGVVVIFGILLSITQDQRTSILLAFLYAFATPILFRTAQLNQNILLANFALFAFALLWRPWIKPGETRKPFYLLAGLCSGWTVVLDYSGIVAVLTLSMYAFACWVSASNGDRKIADLIRYGVGVGISGSVLMAYQWISFGNPVLPAQSYMPPANFTDLGYRGFSWPQWDLLWETAFGMRYGLFTSAPLLLLVFLLPIWFPNRRRLLANRETVFILSFAALFFVFCSANQYGRMQFNTGVRHIVPVIPFLFLLVANVLINLPKTLAVFLGIFGTYWSWCLAMYRDVELGLGIPEAIKHISLEGFQLPWLTTLERMGFVHNASAIPLLFLLGVTIWTIWTIGNKNESLGLVANNGHS